MLKSIEAHLAYYAPAGQLTTRAVVILTLLATAVAMTLGIHFHG